MFNLYEPRQPLMRRKGGFVVCANCRTEVIFHARDVDEAADLFNDYCETVEYHHPEIVFEVTAILEE